MIPQFFKQSKKLKKVFIHYFENPTQTSITINLKVLTVTFTLITTAGIRSPDFDWWHLVPETETPHPLLTLPSPNKKGQPTAQNPPSLRTHRMMAKKRYTIIPSRPFGPSPADLFLLWVPKSTPWSKGKFNWPEGHLRFSPVCFPKSVT